MAVLLKVDNLSAAYGGIHALRGVSLEVQEGEIVAVLGANGAGKSTLLKCIGGVMKTTGGSIEYMGSPLPKHPYEIVAAGVVQVPEARQIFAKLTVYENLRIGSNLRKDTAGIKEDMERVYSIFPRLKEREKQYGGLLSGGEQQMLAIGRALMADPEILLLDEPSLGLAPLIIQDIFKTLQAIRSEGTTILMVEQNALATLKIADYGYVLELGKISMHGPASQLVRDERLIEAYLGNKK